jgi:uncharacterized protein
LLTRALWSNGGIDVAISNAAPWPSYQAMFRLEGARPLYLRRRIRVLLKAWRARRSASALDQAVSDTPWLHAVLKAHPVLFRPVLGPFLDIRRTTPAERIGLLAHDLHFTARRIRAAWPLFFAQGHSARLWRDPRGDWSIELSMNTDFPQEGLWRLSLIAASGWRAFSLCFSVLPGPRVFIGNVQGGRPAATAEGPCLIRAGTKAFEGVRPPHILLHVLRSLARAWGIGEIIGVALDNHLKGHAASRTAAFVRFDYDQFWREAGGAPLAEGNWTIPTADTPRLAEDIPSRKRAMYRRRATLLEAMHCAVVDAAGPGECVDDAVSTSAHGFPPAPLTRFFGARR